MRLGAIWGGAPNTPGHGFSKYGVKKRLEGLVKSKHIQNGVFVQGEKGG
jgi:hypothetical protein